MHPDSGVEVHSSRRWQKSGFAQKKTRSTGSEAICRNGLYAPTAADALCVGPHKANNFPRPAPDSRGVLFELQLEASFAALDRDQAQQRDLIPFSYVRTDGSSHSASARRALCAVVLSAVKCLGWQRTLCAGTRKSERGMRAKRKRTLAGPFPFFEIAGLLVAALILRR